MDIKTLLKEALSKQEMSKVKDYKADLPNDGTLPMGHDASSKIFKSGEDTIRFPLDVKAENVPINSKVKEHLERHGYSIPDSFAYLSNSAVDSKNKIIGIGKALSKTNAPPHVFQAFDNDPYRQSSKHPMHVVITKNPEHVAGMSTDRGWTSCMNMRGGAEHETIKHDLLHGTHVAYLVRDFDKDIKDPIARIAIKPFKSESGHVILRPELKSYGSPNTAFEENVHHFCNTHFPMHHDTYHIAPDVYDDSERHTIKNLPDAKDFLEKGPEIHSRNVNQLMSSPAHRKEIFKNYGKLTDTERRYVSSPYQDFSLTDSEAKVIVDHHTSDSYAIHPRAAFSESIPTDIQKEYANGTRKTRVNGSAGEMHPEVANEVLKHTEGKALGSARFVIPEGADKELSKKRFNNAGNASRFIFNNLTPDDIRDESPDRVHALPTSKVSDYEHVRKVYPDASIAPVVSHEIASHILNNNPKRFFDISADEIEHMPHGISNQHTSLAGNHVSKLHDYTKIANPEAKGFYKAKYLTHMQNGKYSKRHLNQFMNIAEKDGDAHTMSRVHDQLKREYDLTTEEIASHQNRIQKVAQ